MPDQSSRPVAPASGSHITITPTSSGRWTATYGRQTLHTNGHWDWTPTDPATALHHATHA